MKTCIKITSMLLCFAATMSFLSCNGSDENEPLTNESLEGKKYYTNKVYSSYFDSWCQMEVKFSSNNKAYFTFTKTDYGSGETYVSNPIRSTYNMVYPDVVFEDDDGESYSATFVDNGNLKFLGAFVNEELACYDFNWFGIGCHGIGELRGWNFYSNPQTITGPYLGQEFSGGDSLINGQVRHKIIRFGAHTGCLCSYSGITDDVLNVDYPNFTIDEPNGAYTVGRFVDANTLFVTKFWDEDCELTFTRTR